MLKGKQIISYLQSHAHPQMYLSPPPLLHPTIVDQLHLWDKERNRLQTDDGECSYSSLSYPHVSARLVVCLDLHCASLRASLSVRLAEARCQSQ